MRSIVIALTLLSLTACGFHLRGSQPIALSMQTLFVYAPDSQDPLLRVVKGRLERQKINVLADADADKPQILLSDGVLTRRLLSLFPSGQVAEYELIYSVKWALKMPGNDEPQSFEFDILREYQDDPDQVLAKSREINLILQEMRLQAAENILQTLSSQSISH